MRAFAVAAFGEQPALRDLPVPRPGPGEVLVRVAAAGVNPADWKIAAGGMAAVVEHGFPLVLGIDGSGVVEDVGAGARWRAGDEVFGLLRNRATGGGSYAEYVVAGAGEVARKPAGVDHLSAAALPTPGVTALDALDAAHVGAGTTLLVVGAAGGVGTVATQLAARRDALVIGVCGPANLDYIAGLGAAETVDHTAGDVATAVRAMHPGGVDAVLDLVGGRAAVNQLRPVVRDGGNIVSIAGGVDRHLPAERGIDAANVRMRVTTARLEEVAALVASGGLRLHLSGVVPLERAGDAVAQSRAGHVRGKLVITVS